jgi:hypothetical protein
VVLCLFIAFSRAVSVAAIVLCVSVGSGCVVVLRLFVAFFRFAGVATIVLRVSV